MQPVDEDSNRRTQTRRRRRQQAFESEIVRRHCHFLTPLRVVASNRIKAQTHGLPAALLAEIEALMQRKVEPIDGARQQTLGRDSESECRPLQLRQYRGAVQRQVKRGKALWWIPPAAVDAGTLTRGWRLRPGNVAIGAASKANWIDRINAFDDPRGQHDG